MNITLNLEAPLSSTIGVMMEVLELIPSDVIKCRAEVSKYDGPDGPVDTQTFVVFLDDVWPSQGESVARRLAKLAEQFDQDCVAYKIRSYGQEVSGLSGPRADKWLPFNPEFFMEY